MVDGMITHTVDGLVPEGLRRDSEQVTLLSEHGTCTRRKPGGLDRKFDTHTSTSKEI